ncbi:hypothetical protein BGW41_000455 [Actinomortierella wolfii]|nr:hypothetical protein BGW41_000455 [Actinomortierella wolfii]
MHRLLKSWGLVGKVIAATTDAESNVIKTFLSDKNIMHFTCLAHAFHNSMNDALVAAEPIQEIVSKCRSLATLICSSYKHKERLAKFALENGHGRGELLMGSTTRWDSTCTMLRCFITLRTALTKLKDTMYRENDPVYNKAPWLQDNEWDVLEVLVECLQLFKRIAMTISTSPHDSTLEAISYSEHQIPMHFDNRGGMADEVDDDDDTECVDGSDIEDSDIEYDEALEEDGDEGNGNSSNGRSGNNTEDVQALHCGLAADTVEIIWLILRLVEDLKNDLPVPEGVTLDITYKQAFDRLLNTLAEKIEERIKINSKVVTMTFLHPAHVNLLPVPKHLREKRDKTKNVRRSWEHVLWEECRKVSSNQECASVTNTQHSQFYRQQPMDRIEKIKERKKDVEYDAFKDKVEPPSGIAEEILRYRRTAGYDSIQHPGDIEPLSWWAAHKQDFPILARVARRLLSIVASSVASERLFSQAEVLIAKRRSRLSDKTINAMVVAQFASKMSCRGFNQ